MHHDDALRDVVEWISSHHFGKYRGTVTDNADPEMRGRIKVSVPAVLGTLEVWAMPCVPYAGSGVGLYALPDSGTGVWVEFEGGDPTYPVWTGCFWGAGELPDLPDAGVKVLRTSSLTLRLDDTAGEALLSSDSGGQIAVTSDVVTQAGGATHEVGAAGVSASKGLGSLEVSDSGTTINGSALEVT